MVFVCLFVLKVVLRVVFLFNCFIIMMFFKCLFFRLES